MASTRPLHGPYLALGRSWGEYARLRFEAARLTSLLPQQVFGLFPELLCAAFTCPAGVHAPVAAGCSSENALKRKSMR